MVRTALLIAGALFCTLQFSNLAYAFDKEAAQTVYDEKIKAWLETPEVMTALKAQNEKHADLTQKEIIALDEKWRADDEALISSVLENDLSEYLTGVVENGGGLYSELFIIDNKGLNVGQSAKTSDYWQGDEPKYSETYEKGPNSIHISDVEFDESSQLFQVQMSVTISENGEPIGVATIGMDAEALE